MAQKSDLSTSNRFMMQLLERVKADIERLHPNDEIANKLINELLYRFAWKVKDGEAKLKS